ncbi:uncharacterized protein LOC117172781 [Belonocnema kinseyi]|uniref:uncharacterized protein LOC117172781 n=1 Tax=Belonocnema kinseyi TaxID=2817044 RepID=UPI00143D3B3D|nr:uncharacterized protein LOC117172781 [Belonocnema kinseyi]
MKDYFFVTLLILGFVNNGSTENFVSISSKIIESTSFNIFGDIELQCDQNSSPIAFRIFKKAENLLKSRLQMNLQKSFTKMIRSNSVVKKNWNGLCDIDSAVDTYIVAAKSCLIEKKIQYQAEEFSNSILERKLFSTPEIEDIVKSICDEMKSVLRDAVDSRCFNTNIPELRKCFRDNRFFKHFTSILTDSKINISPRNFPYHVIRTSQPSFRNDIKEIIEFRRCFIQVLKTCEFSSLGSDLEMMFLPFLDRLESLLY